MNYKKIHKIINQYGLKPATRRSNPLFTLSCIALGYTTLLKKKLGFSFEAVGAIGGRNDIYTLLNESYIASKTGKFIERNNWTIIKKIMFIPAQVLFNDIKKEVEKINSITDKNPTYCLKVITNFYPSYFLAIGFYNCLWRYIGNQESKGKLSKQRVKNIAKERDKIAKLYPEIDKIIKKCATFIGRKNNFKGELLCYMTWREMRAYLKRGRLSKYKLGELMKRRKKYFYLFVGRGSKEIVETKRDIINRIYKKYFRINKDDINLLEGYPAFPGLTRGIVYKLADKRKVLELPKKFILVAGQTHPKDIVLIKRSSAIITDEGGVLSHAAIVSRELGKPCVIGTKIATQVLRDGDLVEVDANKGVVKILKRMIIK